MWSKLALVLAIPTLLAQAQECPLKPEPTHNFDFTSSAATTDAGFVLHGNARILEPAPDGVDRALRIDAFGSTAVLSGIDIGPSKMKDCTVAIGVYLETIKEDSLGWILSHDNGGFDRAVVLHDHRFNGLGISTGFMGKVYPEFTLPKTQKWIQIVAIFRQGGDSVLYVDGEKAPVTLTGKAGEGKPNLQIGQPLDFPTYHDSDSWVKDVQIYDRALSEAEVEALFCVFKDETVVNCGDHRAVTCNDCIASFPTNPDGCSGDCKWDHEKSANCIQRAEGACVGEAACLGAPEAIIQENACVGTYACNDCKSINAAKDACVGFAACQCNYFSTIEEKSCVGVQSCMHANGAAIQKNSCNAVKACGASYKLDDYTPRNWAIGEESCNKDFACFDLSMNVSIGAKSCNCGGTSGDSPGCCSGCKENAIVPDGVCNTDEKGAPINDEDFVDEKCKYCM